MPNSNYAVSWEASIDPDERAKVYIRHLVLLSCIVAPKNEKRPFLPTPMTFTGFVMSVGSQWIWVTAGHCLKYLDDLLYQGKRLYDMKLCPCWSKNGGPEIKLPFEVPPFVSDLELGLDYGYILLKKDQRALLEADGIIPFDETRWKGRPRSFDGFEIIGVPGKLWNTSVTSKSEDVAHVEHSVVIALAPVVVNRTPPTKAVTKYLQFYGNLKDVNDDGTSDRRSLESIVGMSGGPIIGVGREDSGKLCYWPVAIQSSWLSDIRLVCACPVLAIGNAVESCIGEAKGKGLI